MGDMDKKLTFVVSLDRCKKEETWNSLDYDWENLTDEEKEKALMDWAFNYINAYYFEE